VTTKFGKNASLKYSNNKNKRPNTTMLHRENYDMRRTFRSHSFSLANRSISQIHNNEKNKYTSNSIKINTHIPQIHQMIVACLESVPSVPKIPTR